MSNIRDLIKLSGIKQSVLAKEFGTSQAAISDWCTGKKNPSIDNLIAFARYFHVSVGCVVGEEPIPENFPNHFPSAPIKEGDPLPAFIGTKQVRKVSGFSKEQQDYLEGLKAEIAEQTMNEVLAAIREDLSSSPAANQGASNR